MAAEAAVDRDFEVEPVITSARDRGAGRCAEIKVERADGAKALKEAEEASIKGEDVTVHFKLPDGSTVAASFPIGQDIAFLKGHLQRERGFPIEKQIFSAGGQVLIDPLSLRDYPIFTAVAAAGAAGGSVDVAVQLREE